MVPPSHGSSFALVTPDAVAREPPPGNLLLLVRVHGKGCLLVALNLGDERVVVNSPTASYSARCCCRPVATGLANWSWRRSS